MSVPDKQASIYGPVITLTVLSSLLVPLRLWARRISTIGLWWDDWVLVIAWCGALMDSGFCLANTYYGAGKHIQDIRGPLSSFLYYLYLNEVITHVTIGITKISFVLLYARVFAVKSVKTILWTLGAFIVAWQLGTWPVLIAQCVPLTAIWNPDVKGSCVDIKKFFFGQAIPDVIFDIILLCLPIILVVRLQMHISQKVAVLAVFSLGVFDMVCSILRLSSFIILPTYAKDDVPWYYVLPISWSMVEVHIGIICASLITLKPLLIIFWPSRFAKHIGEVSYKTRSTSGTITNNRSRPWSKYARGPVSHFSRLDDADTRDGSRPESASFEHLTGLHPDGTAAAVASTGRPVRSGEFELDQIVVQREIEVSESSNVASKV